MTGFRGPESGSRVEGTARNFSVELNVRFKIPFACYTSQVALDLRLCGVRARPVWIWFEGERVEMRPNFRSVSKDRNLWSRKHTVAAAPRIFVVAPRAAYSVALF